MQYGILGLVIFVLDVWAILNIWKSGAGQGEKLVWSLVILVLPFLGLIVWFIMGPKSSGKLL